MITVEYYDNEKHGYHDDCDYIVKFDNDDYDLAITVAEKLSVCDYEVYNVKNMIYCCHA